jgi:hypothetical protein
VRERKIKELTTFTEKQWQNYVIRFAELSNWLPYHTHDSRRSHKGFPDLVLVRPPRICFIELKTEKGRIRPEQKLWADRLSCCTGVEYYLWRPSQEPEVREVLKR